MRHESWVNSVAFSPDGKWVATAYSTAVCELASTFNVPRRRQIS